MLINALFSSMQPGGAKGQKSEIHFIIFLSSLLAPGKQSMFNKIWKIVISFFFFFHVAFFFFFFFLDTGRMVWRANCGIKHIGSFREDFLFKFGIFPPRKILEGREELLFKEYANWNVILHLNLIFDISLLKRLWLDISTSWQRSAIINMYERGC